MADQLKIESLPTSALEVLAGKREASSLSTPDLEMLAAYKSQGQQQQQSAAPATPPAQGLMEAVGTYNADPVSNPQKAIQYGAAQWLPFVAGRLALNATDAAGITASKDPASMSAEIRNMISKPQGYEPQTTADQALATGVSFIDPTAPAVGRLASKAVAPLISQRAARLAMLEKAAQRPSFYSEAVKPAAQAVLDKAASLRPIVNGVGTAGASGVIGAGTEVARQIEETGGVSDPMRVAQAGAVSTVLGGGLGYAGGKLGNVMAQRRYQAVTGAKAAFEVAEGAAQKPIDFSQGVGDATGDEAQAIINKNVQNARGISNKIDVLESQVNAQKAKGAVDPALQRQLSDNYTALQQAVGDDGYRQVMAAREAVAKTVTDPKTRQQLIENIISDRGVVLDPDVVNAALGLQDISAINATAFSFKDMPRLLESSEGQLRGKIFRAYFEPLNRGYLSYRNEVEKGQEEFVRLANQIGLRPNAERSPLARLFGLNKTPSKAQVANAELNARLFDAAEGKQVPNLTAQEEAAVRWGRRMYDEMLERINLTRRYNNQAPIKARKNYVTHIGELNQAASIGEDLATSELKTLEKIPFRFDKQRQGGEFEKDFFTAVSAYHDAALKTVHLTAARNQALAITQFMPKNLQKESLRFLNSSTFGGVDSADDWVNNHLSPELLKIGDQFKQIFASSQIGGNLNVIVQQPSSAIAAVPTVGLRNSLKALHQVLTVSDDIIEHKSGTYKFRTASNDFFKQAVKRPPGMLSQVGEKFDKFSSATIGTMDKVVYKHTWLSAYNQAKERWMLTDAGASRYADKIANSFHGVYNDLYRPGMLRGRAKGAVFAYQTFAMNLFNALAHDSKFIAQLQDTKQSTQLAKMVGGMLGANAVYEFMGLPTPFNLGVGQTEEGGVTFDPTQVRIGPLGIGAPPLVNVALQAKKPVQTLYRMITDEDAEPDEMWPQLNQEMARFGSNFIKGGGQIYKTVKGVRDLNRGFTQIGRSEVDLDPRRDAPAALVFGPGAAPSVNEWRREQKSQ